MNILLIIRDIYESLLYERTHLDKEKAEKEMQSRMIIETEKR